MASAVKRLEAVPGTPAPQISFDAVTLQLGGKTIIENLSLGVRPGEFLCIVGASGCGKTTALRLAAGLYQPTSGKVNFDGQKNATWTVFTFWCWSWFVEFASDRRFLYGNAIKPSIVIGICGCGKRSQSLWIVQPRMFR